MLILTRKPGEAIYIGDIKVIIVEIKGNQIRVGIEAPSDVRIYREEIWLQIKDENKRAAAAAQEPGMENLGGLSKAWGSKKLSDSPGLNFSSPMNKVAPEIVKKKGRKQSDD